MHLSIDQERQYTQRQMEFRQLGNDLANASDFLTREARRYTLFGDQRHFDAYWHEVNVLKTRDKVVERLRELDATSEELALIKTAKANSDALIATEKEAMNAVEQGDLVRAQILMFDENYDRNKKIIMSPIKTFQTIMNVRAENEARAARDVASRYQAMTYLAILLYVIFAVCALHLVVGQRVSRPLSAITKAIDQLASGETATAVPYTKERNEIGRLARAAEIFKINHFEKESLATEIKQHRDALKQEVDKQTHHLREANTELEEFTYRISHDLRSPIVSSVRLLSMAQESIGCKDSQTAVDCLSHAQNSLNKLETLIQDLLDISETKNKEEENQPIDTAHLVAEALANLQYLEGYESLEIQTDFQFNELLLSKTSRVNRILENLISNAIKYRDPEVEASYIKISTHNVEGHYVLEVEDNGLGIPEKQQDRLFTMFMRFHPKVAFGSGLGLYLIKKSVDVLGGTIAFHNNGNGSTFRIKIPFQDASCCAGIDC